MIRWTYIKVKTKWDKRQVAVYFNRPFEELSTQSSFKWSVQILGTVECRRSTVINFGTFVAFDLHKQIPKRFTV